MMLSLLSPEMPGALRAADHHVTAESCQFRGSADIVGPNKEGLLARIPTRTPDIVQANPAAQPRRSNHSIQGELHSILGRMDKEVFPPQAAVIALFSLQPSAASRDR